MTARGVGAFTSLTLAVALPACIPGPGPCTPTEGPADFRIRYESNRLVDASARPAVEGLLTVGSIAVLGITTSDGNFCGPPPSVTWNVTNPSVARVAGGAQQAHLTATAAGHTDVVATVRYGRRTSEAALSWCQPPPGHDPFRSVLPSDCTWVPMSGVRVVE